MRKPCLISPTVLVGGGEEAVLTLCIHCASHSVRGAGPDSYFDKFITATLTQTPDERAVALEEDDEVSVMGGTSVDSHVVQRLGDRVADDD